MPLVANTSATAPFDKLTYRPLRRTAPMFLPPQVRRGKPDPYSQQMAAHRPRQVDPYQFPTGGLGDLGDSATGIPAVDNILATATAKIDKLVLATEIGMVAGVIGAACGLILLFDRRR